MSLQNSLLAASATRALFSTPTGGFHPMLRGPQVAYAPDDDGTSPLSLAEAVALRAEKREAPADEPADEDEIDDEAPTHEDDAPTDTDTPADDQAADGDDAPDEDPASEEDPEEDEDDAPETPASDAPKFWSAEEKALFAKAPPEVQQLVAAKVDEAEKRVYAAKEEAAEERKKASVFVEARQQVDQLLERAESVFQGKWDGMTPETWAQWAKDDPNEYTAAKAEYDLEQAELERVRTAAAATATEEHRTFLADEAAKLKEANHPLADPVKGAEEKKALVTYAETQGFKPGDLKWAGAAELSVLHKAMLYDRAQARLATKPNPPPVKDKPKAAAVRPTASPVQGSQSRRAIEAAQAEFDKNPSMENALALRRAKRT